jgi:septum formation protein
MLSLLKNIDNFDLILASESPRRYELLKMIGLNFKVRPSHVEEIYQNHLKPIEYALENAQKKGNQIANKFPTSIVISADTIVVLKNEILEKPEDEMHAYRILRKLSGNTHKVITGFGFMLNEKQQSLFDYEVTEVTFRNLKECEIRAYVNSGEPFDKAGGYGAQGYGSLLIKSVKGCFFNVVGLPLSKFFILLDKFLLQLK